MIHYHMPKYDSLQDKNLHFHFYSQVRRKHLQKMGLINSKEQIAESALHHSLPKNASNSHPSLVKNHLLLPKMRSPYEENLLRTTYQRKHPYLSRKP